MTKINNTHSLTDKGKIASILQEVNSVAFTESIYEDMFKDVSSEELASILSSFTNIKVSEDIKEIKCFCKNRKVKEWVDYISSNYNGLYDMELKECQKINENNYIINYDFNDIILDWCKATTEEECKQILIQVYDKGIFLGEFVKMILKINNIANELNKVADLTLNIPFKHILSKIPELTLKYVVTNQSLYI